MTNFNVGDRVKYVGTAYRFSVDGDIIGTVRAVGDGYEVLFPAHDDNDTLYCHDAELELVTEPTFGPGQRVRGVVEGVISFNKYYVETDSGHVVNLESISDLTVIKTLPTAPGSVIEFNEVLFTLTAFKTVSGKSIWWPVTGRDSGSAAIEYYGEEFGDNWTLKYDAA